MTAKMEYTGKDVDEAIRVACENLGVTREQLDIEVKSTGSSGIFGLCKKKAAVIVGLKEGRKTVEPVEIPESPVPREKKKEAPGAVEMERPGKETAGPVSAKVPVGAPVAPEELEKIKDILQEIIRLMGFPSPVTVFQDENNKVLAHITGENIDSLIGQEGQTLDSLQYLMRKIVSKKYPEKIIFVLDAGDFRETRMKELEERALTLAQEVKKTGKTKAIPAINPAERRIVHMALQDDTEIRSRSVGDGLFKKVLIYLPSKGRKKPPRRRKGSNNKVQTD